MSEQPQNFEKYLRDKLKDKNYAKMFLKEALDSAVENGEFEDFLISLKVMAGAKGGMSKLSKQTKLTRQSLYKALSSKGNPTLLTLDKILKNLGYRLTLESVKKQA